MSIPQCGPNTCMQLLLAPCSLSLSLSLSLSDCSLGEENGLFNEESNETQEVSPMNIIMHTYSVPLMEICVPILNNYIGGC